VQQWDKYRVPRNIFLVLLYMSHACCDWLNQLNNDKQHHLQCNCSSYTLLILDYIRQRRKSKIAIVVGDCPVPPAPSDVRVLSRSSHSLLIGWQAPYPPHGVITQYLLKHRRQHMHYGVPFLIVLSPTSNIYNITSLQPNVVYDIQVFYLNY